MNTQKIDVQGVASAKGLLDDEVIYLQKLINVYNKKLTNNVLQWQYYKDKHIATNLGMAVPQDFANCLNTSIGWAAKAVDMLAQRSIFDGYIIDGDSNSILDSILLENDFKLLYEMAVPSELVHSCGFWSVTASDEPGKNKTPVIRYYNAQNAAALWNYNKGRILAGFCITDYNYDTSGNLSVSHIVLHTDDKAVEIDKPQYGSWSVTSRQYHKMGRPLMEAMSYCASVDRPFGKSRISPTIMGITDEMQREVMRMALTAEMYSAPARIIFGADEEKFTKPKDSLYHDKIWLLERDEDGNLPAVEQLKQVGMTPHIEVMRNLASRMAAEASVPVNSLGIIHDNPASAEALRASMEDLCMLAENLNRGNNKTLRNVAKLALAIYHNKSYNDLSDEEKSVSVCFKNPYTPSIASQTDAMIKQASVTPWLTYLEIYWKALGYNDEEREIILKGKDKAEAEMYLKQNIPNIKYADQMPEYNQAPAPTEDVNTTEPEKEEEKLKEKEDGNNNKSNTKLVQG